MRLPLIPLLAALVASLVTPTWSWAEEHAPVVPDSAAAAPAEHLLDRLPQAPSVIARDGAVYWDNNKGAAYRITGVAADGGAILDTEIGALPVAKSFLVDDRTDALSALPRLIASAATAQVGEHHGLALAEGIMTGVHLRSDPLLVLDEGLLRKIPTTPADRQPEITTIASALANLSRSISPERMNGPALRAVDDAFARLTLTDDARKFEHDEMLPSFARRIVRNGYARMLTTEKALAVRLEDAVTQAESMQAVTVYDGENLRLSEVKNAFGQGGWVLETPSRTSFARSHPAPMYAWGAERWNLLLVVDLPAGSDPMVDGAKTKAARLFHGNRVIAQWAIDSGFQSDIATWRVAVPNTGRHVEETTVSNFLPPHLVVIDLDGDVRMLATAHGVLVPPRDPSTPEAERFLSDAAAALPDAAHLDLIGEHLFYYVYDSPDPRSPLLIGNRQVKGDIHQTAYETISTVANGMCRGDCDDLAELYQEIIERQGKLAHIITLPAHAAAAFAEQKGERWHVHVLQTGQPREFIADDLPEALRLAYLSFDDSDNFDPNGLGLLLRFSGENTRGPWRLSWRIFSEPDYARTMIDVQKDWHYSTYQRGIHKMEAMMAAGDDDTANHRELAGLASFTGQHEDAAQHMREALARTEDPESKLYISVELVQHLFQAKQPAEARTVAERLLNEDFPRLKDQMGNRAFQFGFQLANACSGGRGLDHAEGEAEAEDDKGVSAAYDLAERAIAETMMTELSQQIDQIAGWLDSPQFSQRRWEAADSLRRMQRLYIGACISVINGVGSEGIARSRNVQQMVRSVQTWLDRIAFRDVQDPDDALSRYITAAAFYQALLGKDRFRTLLDSVPLATTAKHEHGKRVGGLAQLQLDLPWINAAPTYWYSRIAEIAGKKEAVNRDQVHLLGQRLEATHANLATLDIHDGWLDNVLHQGRLVVALLTENEEVLRERLRHVTAMNDKRLRDTSSTWLGDVARHCSPDWYAKVLQLWQEECDYKPKYYWIAWRAALSDAPAHALMAAEVSAKRFPGDASFQEELVFMRELFGKNGP